MRPRVLIGVIGAALVAFMIFGFGMQVGARSSYGAGWWGPGIMGGYTMGPGMMRGYGYPWARGRWVPMRRAVTAVECPHG